jgi:hypothetical protein
VLQQAADVGAQELARLPLPPDIDDDELEAALASGALADIYDETKLVLLGPIEEINPNELPLINRLLFPLYVRSGDLLHYPGTLALNSDGGPVVLIPLINDRDVSGVEDIGQWVKVVEVAIDEERVTLQINYPYQTAAMVAHQYRHEDGTIDGIYTPGEHVENIPVLADDAAVERNLDKVPTGYSIVGGSAAPQYAGELGLGELQAYATRVRPYRKVVQARGIYRREVYGDLPSEP